MNTSYEKAILTPTKESVNAFMEESLFDTPVPQATSTVHRPRTLESYIDSQDANSSKPHNYVESFARKLDDLKPDTTVQKMQQLPFMWATTEDLTSSEAGCNASSLGILHIDSSIDFPGGNLSENEVGESLALKLCSSESPDQTTKRSEESYLHTDLRLQMERELARLVIERATNVESSLAPADSKILNQHGDFHTDTSINDSVPLDVESISTDFNYMTKDSRAFSKKNPFTSTSQSDVFSELSSEEFISGELAADKLKADEENYLNQKAQVPQLSLQDVNADFSQVTEGSNMNVSIDSVFLGSEHHGEHKQVPIADFFRLKGDKIEDMFKEGSKLETSQDPKRSNWRLRTDSNLEVMGENSVKKDEEGEDNTANSSSYQQNTVESVISPPVMSKTKIADIISNSENLSPQSFVDQFLKHLVPKKSKSLCQNNIDDNLSRRVLRDQSNTVTQESLSNNSTNSKLNGLEIHLSNMSLFDYQDSISITSPSKLGKHKPLEESSTNKLSIQQAEGFLTSVDTDGLAKRLKIDDGSSYEGDSSDLQDDHSAMSGWLKKSDCSLSLLPASDVEMTTDISDEWILMTDTLSSNKRRTVQNHTPMQPDLLNLINLVTPSGDTDILNFGLLPESCCDKLTLTVMNRHKKKIPLKVRLKNTSDFHVFAIANISVDKPCEIMHKDDEDECCFTLQPSDRNAHIAISFNTPALEQMGESCSVLEFSGIVLIEMNDSPKKQKHQMLVRGRVGLTRLSFNRFVMPSLGLACGVGEVVTHPFPMKNLGLVPLTLELTLLPIDDNEKPVDEPISIQPSTLKIMPGAEESAMVCFVPKKNSASVTVRRLVATVQPNGASYEANVRGVLRTRGGKFRHWESVSSSKVTSDPSKRTLVENIETTHNELVWPSIRLGRMLSKTCTIKNSSRDITCKVELQVTINDPTKSFKVLNEFGGRMDERQLVLHSEDVYRLNISLLPMRAGALCGKIEFSPQTPSAEQSNHMKSVIRLYAYGGHSKLCIHDIPKDGAGRLWLSLGELSAVHTPLVAQFKLQNMGNLPAFARMKFLMKGLGSMLSSNLVVEPSHVVIQPEATVNIRILYQQSFYGSFPPASLEVIEVATLQILHGDEPTRLRLRRVVSKMECSGKLALEPQRADMLELSQIFPGETAIADVAFLRDPESAGRMLYQSLTLQEVSLIVDKPNDISMLGMRSIMEDSTRLFKPLGLADSTTITRYEATLSEPVSMWSVWPLQLKLDPPSVVSGNVEVRNQSGQTHTFEAEVSENSIIVVEPSQGIIAPFEKVTLTVYCKALPIINQNSKYILKIYLENEVQHVEVTVENCHQKSKRVASTQRSSSVGVSSPQKQYSLALHKLEPKPCETSTPIAKSSTSGSGSRPKPKYSRRFEKIISGSLQPHSKCSKSLATSTNPSCYKRNLHHTQKSVCDVSKRSHSSSSEDLKRHSSKDSIRKKLIHKTPVSQGTSETRSHSVSGTANDTISVHGPNSWVIMKPTNSPGYHKIDTSNPDCSAAESAKNTSNEKLIADQKSTNVSDINANEPPLEDMLLAMSLKSPLTVNLPDDEMSIPSSFKLKESGIGGSLQTAAEGELVLVQKSVAKSVEPKSAAKSVPLASSSHELKQSVAVNATGRVYSDNYDISFPATVVGTTTAFKVTVKNSSSQIFQLEMGSVSPPFSTKVTTFELKGKWYMSFRVYFRPLSVGFYEQLLIVKPIGGSPLMYRCSGKGVASV